MVIIPESLRGKCECVRYCKKKKKTKNETRNKINLLFFALKPRRLNYNFVSCIKNGLFKYHVAFFIDIGLMCICRFEDVKCFFCTDSMMQNP